MLAGMSARQFAEWQAFALVDGPFGEWRADFRSALAASGLANCWGAKSRPKDFMPQWEPPRRQSNAEIHQVMELWAIAVEKEQGKG